MHGTDYGPFADVVAAAGALVSVFSVLLVKMLGKVSRWSALAGGSPPFVVTFAARALAVVLMAATLVLIDKGNAGWFLGGGFFFAVVASLAAVILDHERRLFVRSIPLVDTKGAPLRDHRGRAVTKALVIGREDHLLPAAQADFDQARKDHGGLSLAQFMSGYGATTVNDPEAIWSTSELARVNSRFTMLLIAIVLSAVMALFLASFGIVVLGRAH